MSYLLGIDVGTSGTKSLLIDERGNVVASHSASHPLHTPKPGWSEQAPRDWWQSVVESIHGLLGKLKAKGPAAKKASAKSAKKTAKTAAKSSVKTPAKSGFDPAAIKAIGLSGQMHGSVFLSAKGQVVRRALLWNDQRTAAQCAEIERLAGGRAELIKLVSNPALTGFTAPKILWLRDAEPAKYETVAKVLLPKDYIRWKLTGGFATEVSDASGTLLLDVKGRSWCRPLLEKLGIPLDWLPPVHESPTITGTLTAAAAAETGLAEGTPVVGGAGDCAAGAVGTGIVTPGVVSCSLGTSGVVFAHDEQPETDPAGRVHTFCHAVPGKWHVMGVMLSAAGSLEWFREALGEPEATAAAKAKRSVFELLIDESAAAAPAGCEGLMFLPYLTGERTPHADPHARGAWIGLSRRSSKPHMIRSLLEGVTFGLRDSVEIMRRLGVSVKEIRALGGGAQSPFWRQLLADNFASDIVGVNTDEGGPAFGVALLAGVGAGVWSSVEEACAATIKTAGKVRPKPKSVELYATRYPLWQSLYRSLRGDFAQLAALGES